MALFVHFVPLLQFENNLIRCNAAEIFFDVYPLEYHGEAKPDRIMHLDRQHQEMADLLVDDSHLVRVLAVRVSSLVQFLIKYVFATAMRKFQIHNRNEKCL